MEKNGKALVEHWQWASEKGLMNNTSARLLRNACFQVLNAQDGWESLDVEELDIEETFRRFQNLNGRNLAPRSLKDYKRRFSQGVASFLDYLRDPANWKGPLSERASRLDSAIAPNTKNGRKDNKDKLRRPRAVQSAQGGGRDILIEYPFPIRAGLTARLSLPGDLTVSEAKRLAGFIASLTIDPVATASDSD